MGENLKRVNKITAQFVGDGVIQASFYKTHDKLGSIKSDDAVVVTAGFTIPTGEDVTPKAKLDAFKTFVQDNVTLFGYTYDPIDRRATENKYPNSYTEENISTVANSILSEKFGALVESISKHINSLTKQGLLPDGSTLSITPVSANLAIKERYKNENLKYATVTFSTEFKLADKSTTANVAVELVSGQLKKPSSLGEQAFNLTGLKALLIAGGVLPVAPKVEKAEKEEVAEETTAE